VDDPTGGPPTGMLPTTGPIAEAASPQPDPLDSFRRWAMALFGLLLILIVVGVAVLASAAFEQFGADVLLGGIGIVLGVIALVALLVGLDGRRAWAFQATVAVCWILIGAAVVRVVADLSRGTITIPLEGIVAAVVLTRRPAAMPVLGPGERPLAVLVVLLFLASEAWPLLSVAR
jgi:hypothetical protein